MLENKKIEIPVVFYFDNNYVIPAAVAFYSLLENSDHRYFYKFHVLHSDITLENQKKLLETISSFNNVSLEFIDMQNRFDDLWNKLETKGHFSKETFYKMLVSSMFPQYEKVITSDVDVVFLNDISKSYFMLGEEEPYYLAGIKPVGKIMYYFNVYKQWFSDEEISHMTFCGGYLVMNLREMRKFDMESKFIDFFEKNAYRLNQAEQDILNLCCYPKVKYLPCATLVCSYLYDLYKTDEDFKNDSQYSEEELREAYERPVQLHFATSTKPWRDIACTKSEEWFKYLAKTPFLREYLEKTREKQTSPLLYKTKVKKQFDCGSKYQLVFELRKKLSN